MILWITGIIICLIIASVVFKTNENINNTNWHPAVKFILKTLVWIAGILGAILTAFLVAMLSGPSNKE